MLKPWHLELLLDKQAQQTIHQQLLQQLLQLIDAGYWMEDSPLPSTREIASQLHINRKTVARVYEELTVLGKIYTQPKRGTFVASQRPSLDVHSPLHHKQSQDTSSDFEQQIAQLIQTFVLPHTRRAALHLHKLQTDAYDYRGLVALRQLIALILAHDKRTLVSPEQLVCTSAQSMQAILLALLKARHGIVLLDAEVSEPQQRELQQQGINTLTLPALPDNELAHREALYAEQIEKFCINYPISSLWMVHSETQAWKSQPSAQRLIAKKIQDYDVLLLEDHRHDSFATLQHPSLTTQLPEQSIYIGNLYDRHCEMFDIYFLSLPSQIQSSMLSTLQLLQPDAQLLNMLAHVELIKCGDYKKLKNRLINLIRSNKPTQNDVAQAEKMVAN